MAYKKDEKFESVPYDFKVYQVGHIVCINEDPVNVLDPAVRLKLLKDDRFLVITNAERLIPLNKSVASGDLPAIGASFDLGDISGWLKTGEGTFYDTWVGFLASHFARWQLNMPGGDQRGGSREQSTEYYTSDDSPIFNPRLNLIVLGETHIPKFKLFADSKYTLEFAKLKGIGYKYSYETLTELPTPLHCDFRNLYGVKV